MEKYSFFNSVNGDRKYDVDDWSKWFVDFFTNGIFNNGLQVKAGTGMQIIISPGVAFAQGHKYYNDSDLSHTITIADSDQDRIDNVVLRVDETNRTFTSQIVEGSYAKTPVAPNLIRSTTTYDLRLATINIPAGTTEITTDMITDCRFDLNDCGNVIQAVQNADMTKLFENCKKQVDDIINNIKNILSGDVAGNLQNEIEVIKSMISNFSCENIANCNEVEENGVFYTTSSTLNCPSAKSPYGFLISLVGQQAEVRTQYWTCYRDNQIYIRQYNKVNSNSDGTNRVWSDWEDITVRNSLVYEKTLTADTASLLIPCDILKDGGHYRLVIFGKTTARTDLEITFNNNKDNVYYQSGVYYTGSGTSGDSTLSGNTGYRPAKNRIYFGINFFNQGIGKLEMNIHFDETDKKPFYKWNMDRTYSGDQMTGWGNGQVGGSGVGDNVTSIDIATVSGSLAKGMKIQLFRD